MIHIIQPVQKKSIYSVSSMQELKQPPTFQALQAKDLSLFLATSSVGIDSKYNHTSEHLINSANLKETRDVRAC